MFAVRWIQTLDNKEEVYSWCRDADVLTPVFLNAVRHVLLILIDMREGCKVEFLAT